MFMNVSLSQKRAYTVKMLHQKDLKLNRKIITYLTHFISKKPPILSKRLKLLGNFPVDRRASFFSRNDIGFFSTFELQNLGFCGSQVRSSTAQKFVIVYTLVKSIFIIKIVDMIIIMISYVRQL